MKQLKETFVESARELKNIRSLTGLALLMALGSILSVVLTIQITPSQKIGFGYLATVLMGALYGPVAGGVAANSRIRADFQAEIRRAGIALYVPPLALCGDNAAMIGCQGYYEFLAGNTAGMELNAYANREL